MACTPTDLIEVIYNGKTVGPVTADTRTQFFAFEYAPEWLRGNIQLAPLTLANRRGPRVFPNLAVNTFQRLPAMLADALPDRFGHTVSSMPTLLARGSRDRRSHR